MSIFSNLKRSRQSAKQHNAKLAEQKQKEADKPPYKHIPTHAATDAFDSAPPGWRQADRNKIIEANRRRSAMVASSHHMSMPSIPRAGSNLSYVSFPSGSVTPAMRVPRTHSYTGVSSYGSVMGRELDVMEAQHAHTHKGKEVNRAAARYSEMPRISPTPSKAENPSPESSSSESTTSSQEVLEMRRASVVARGSPAKIHVTARHTPSPVDIDTNAPLAPASRQSSSGSLPALSPTSTRAGSISPNLATPSPLPLSSNEFPFYQVSSPVSENDVWINGMAPVVKQKKRQSRRIAKGSELERIDSRAESQYCEDQEMGEDLAVPTPDEPANFFPEQIAEDVTKVREKKSKSGKRGSKLVKKSRA